VQPLEGVEAARVIRYWGHYPVADLEFETGAPISVGLRAWRPSCRGCARLQHPGRGIRGAFTQPHRRPPAGTLAFNFPGPNRHEAGSDEFTRAEIAEDFRGVLVRSLGGVEYLLGVLGEGGARCGGV